jgi:hypothetical protein
MLNDHQEPKSGNLAATGIWARIMNYLSARTGLSIYWLQFLMLAAGSLTAFLASEGLHRVSGNSAALLFRAAAVVAAVGAVVVLLPSVGRRIVVSFVILFHFGGILTAVTSVPPSPWLSTQIWTTVYRPYLHFMWLNNAYHFYSPQPGPANLLWFCIEYEPDPDGTRNFRWVLYPDLDMDTGRPVNPDGSPVFSGTEYTRRLSLAEYTASSGPLPWNLYKLLDDRLQAGQRNGVFPADPRKLPYDQQYSEPNDPSKRWIQSYVRHVAATYKHQGEGKADLPVKTVKFYRVLHQILDPGQFNAGIDPNFKDLLRPYYCGEFDKDGNLTENCVKITIDSEGRYQAERRDPYLYWLIPVDYIILHAQGRDAEKSDSNMRRVLEDAPEGDKTEVKP